MNFLVVGLGSMGKRRIRCLKALGQTEVFGFDLRQDRRMEAEEKYGINTFSKIDEAIGKVEPKAIIISVPPDVHHIYMKLAIQNEIHFFVEASVVDTDMDDIKESLKQTGISGIPSATLLFHPAIQMISRLASSGDLGKVSNIIYHCGQYLPDWHTYEQVSEYYVSNPATGGAREIVPFELTWITGLWGFPKRVCGNYRKTITISGAEEIEDTYNFLMDYGEFLITATVDVVSRFATRRLLVNGDKKQLIWDWNQNMIQIYDPAEAKWESFNYEMKDAAEGYSPNIGENMYVDEIKAFIQAFREGKPFVNSLENDHNVLKLLYAIEQSDKTGQFVRVEE